MSNILMKSLDNKIRAMAGTKIHRMARGQPKRSPTYDMMFKIDNIYRKEIW